MSRRRYLSTRISIDGEVNRMAQEVGDFAALLYTWMIPHADDDCTLTSDPAELLVMVIPGRRDKASEDVAAAVSEMVSRGLLVRSPDGRRIGYPQESFYRYQTYIPEGRRRPAAWLVEHEANAAQRRTTPHNASTLSPSLSLSGSLSLSPSGSPSGDGASARAADAAPPNPKPPIQAIPKTRELPAELLELRAAFESRGLREPPLTASAEFQAARRLLKRAREPDELAACWQDVRAGDWGDDWDQRNLSMVMLERNDRFGNWQAWKGGEVGTPKQRGNGTARGGLTDEQKRQRGITHA